MLLKSTFLWFDCLFFINLLFIHAIAITIPNRNILANNHHSNNNNDDDINYHGFYTTTTLPYGRSDMTSTTITITVNGIPEERIYLIGGCIQNQQCYYNNISVISEGISCYCPMITNGCTYFVTLTETWYPCASAPRNRYRHMEALVSE